MVNESISFGYLRREDVMYANGERFLLFHVMFNNYESKIYEINFEFHGDARVFYNRICNIIDARIVRNRYAAPRHREHTYLTCTIKKSGNVERVVFEGRDDTNRRCSVVLEDFMSREECFLTVHDLILHH